MRINSKKVVRLRNYYFYDTKHDKLYHIEETCKRKAWELTLKKIKRDFWNGYSDEDFKAVIKTYIIEPDIVIRNKYYA